MPMHDWTRVRSGTYHNFHQGWTIQLRDSLNSGLLPPGYFALADQRIEGPEPDVIAYHQSSSPNAPGLALLNSPPRVELKAKVESDTAAYARKANRLRIQDGEDRVVAILEIVSPGNKDSTHAIRSFVAKAVEFLNRGIHMLVIDPFPPTRRDPNGIHRAIWDELSAEEFPARSADKPLTAVAFDAAENLNVYVEPFAVGDPVPVMPLFLEPGYYVNVPLEMSYRASWDVLPSILRDRIQTSPPA